MSKRTMDNLFKELHKNGFEFEEAESRCWGKFYGGPEDLGVNGFLYNRDETPLTTEQINQILEIAKKKKTYLSIMPELKGRKGGTVVCFLQEGLFKTMASGIPPVTHSLRRHFLYLQEDEKVLKLDEALKQLHSQLASFQAEAYDSALLRDASARLRKLLRVEGPIIEREREICEYMGNALEYNQAEALCKTIYCMRLTR